MSPAEQLISRFLFEKMTRGMKNAYEKIGGVKACEGCRIVVPKYVGRYPQHCPGCNGELETYEY